MTLVSRAAASTHYFLFPVENFPFQVAVFLQSVDKLYEFMEVWGFAISFATNC